MTTRTPITRERVQQAAATLKRLRAAGLDLDENNRIVTRASTTPAETPDPTPTDGLEPIGGVSPMVDPQTWNDPASQPAPPDAPDWDTFSHLVTGGATPRQEG